MSECYPKGICSYKERYTRQKGIDRAIIVEPREHPALYTVLENVCEKTKLPITIFHGNRNKDFVRDIAQKVECVDSLKEINAEDLDGMSYSKLLMSSTFWENVESEGKVLLFQTDSGINGRGKDMQRFEEYDYCGAPWLIRNGRVGNGGFSIRNVSKAREHVKNSSKIIHEDMYFVEKCEGDPECKICPKEIGIAFSTETIPSKSWAFHNNWTYYNSELTPFNKKVRDLNKKSIPILSRPDLHTWNPTITDTEVKGTEPEKFLEKVYSNWKVPDRSKGA